MKLISTNKRAYLYIRSISLTSSPRPRDGRECSIRMVKFSIICIQEEGCEGFLNEKKKKKRKSIIWPFWTQLFSFFVKHDFFGNLLRWKPFWNPFDTLLILSFEAGSCQEGLVWVTLGRSITCHSAALAAYVASWPSVFWFIKWWSSSALWFYDEWLCIAVNI